MMKEIKTSHGHTVIVSQDVDMCGDCHNCLNPCEKGLAMMARSWSEEEVAEACDLIMEGNKFLSELKSLEEYK